MSPGATAPGLILLHPDVPKDVLFDYWILEMHDSAAF